MPKAKYVVSANYIDTKNKKYPWMYRKVEDGIHQYFPAKSVHATGVYFGESYTGESGFGCSVVAYCETILCDEFTPPETDLHAIDFDGFDFVRRYDEKIIYSCEHLILKPNGGMFIAPDEEFFILLSEAKGSTFSYEF